MNHTTRRFYPSSIHSISRSMKHFLLFVCAAMFACQTIKAQSTYTDRLRQAEAGKGIVVINHSAEIDRIVNGTKATTNKSKTSTTTSTVGKSQTLTRTETKTNVSLPNHTAAASSHGEEPKHNNKAPYEPSQKSEAKTTKPTAKHEGSASSYINRTRHKARGFRICIFTGGNSRADKIKASQMGDKCRQKFRELATYTTFVPPRWETHVGDFKTRQEAQKYVNLIRRAHITYEVRIVTSEVNIPD